MNRVRRCCLFLILGIFLTACAVDLPPSSFRDGVASVDMTAIHLDDRSPRALRGPWEFYWNQLHHPSEFRRKDPPRFTSIQAKMGPWTGEYVDGRKLGGAGMATYRMRIHFPPNSGRVGIWYPHQRTASRLFVDGELLGAVGFVGSAPEEAVGGRVDTAAFFVPKGGETEIIVHVANNEHFLGGLRGELVVGTENAVRRYVAQRDVFVWITLGLVFGAALYHLAFFLMHRSETSFLLFSLVCLSLALRLPAQMSKVYLLFLPDFSWAAVARYQALLNVVTIPLAGAFLRSMLPHHVSANSVRGYLAVSVVALLVQPGPAALVSRFNAVYSPVMFSIVVIQTAVVLWQAFRKEEVAALMTVGLVALGILAALAIVSDNVWAKEGGPYAVGAYALFVFIHSLALSRFFLGAVRAKASLTASLNESRLALARQREELQINLHDSLGGALTDLQIYTEQQMASSSASALQGLHARIVDTVKMFRSQLLLMEDLEMTVQELIPGIQMTLLRRYADAGREIDFEVAQSVHDLMQEGELFPVNRASDVFFLVLELCTNDLKYGRGESFWRIHQNGDHLVIAQRNGSGSAAGEAPTVPARATERARKLNGTVRAEMSNGEYSVEVSIPLRRK